MNPLKPFIIAEVAQAHDGNLNIAHAFIDAVAETGVDAIKFQTHYADEETSHAEPWRQKFSYIKESRFEYWKRMEFTPDEWKSLVEHSKDVRLTFMSSPFSLKANKILDSCGMKYWKIASGELTNYPLIDDICKRGGKILVSCGLAEEEEITDTVSRIKQKGGIIMAIMQCTSKYPTALEEVDLSVMKERGLRMNLPYGLSDHSSDVLPAICAMSLGANVIEVHTTFHEDYFGPDNSSSLTMSQMKELVLARDKISLILGSPKTDFDCKDKMKKIFRKSIYLSRDIKKGMIISIDDISFKKPSAGIGAEAYETVLGCSVLRDLVAGSPLQWNDLKS